MKTSKNRGTYYSPFTDELSEGALANGDVARNDGKITLEDVMTLLYYLSGRITSFES